jgi:hypothetical protein
MFGLGGPMKALVMSLAVLSLTSLSSSVTASSLFTASSLVSNSNTKTDLSARTKQKLQDGKRLNLRERKQVRTAEKEKYVELRRQGVDEVSTLQRPGHTSCEPRNARSSASVATPMYSFPESLR